MLAGWTRRGFALLPGLTSLPRIMYPRVARIPVLPV